MDFSLNNLKIAGKPKYKKLSEDYNFFQLFKKIEKKYKTCFLFESLGEESNISRYHILGFEPKYIITCDKNHLIILDKKNNPTKKIKTKNPYNLLKQYIPTNIISKKYAGGLIGYLGYDCINFFEKNINVKTSNSFEPFKFGFFLDGLVYDQVTGEIFYYFYQEDRFKLIQKIMNDVVEVNENLTCEFLGNSMEKKEHSNAIKNVKDMIVDGLIFQCEVGYKSFYKIEGNTTKIYEQLRKINPSPHMYFLKFDDQKIIGASPELLFRLRNGEMETYPLAGTTKRGKNRQEDTKLARELLNDPKEIAEHNMLVDLHRNDIGRVAKFGTVKVRNLMDIKRYSHVQHISSEIVGIIDDDQDMFSSLASNFPAGTLTGAPKIEAMKIIDKIENDGRGPYGGAVGQFSFNGDCTFAIPIRSIFIKDNFGYVQTCGGIVYDSETENEFIEIERKLQAMKSVLESFKKK